jgi:hypothetical protein
MDPQYSDILTEHFTNPRNVGSLDKDSPRVGTGIVGTEDCGDVIKLQIEAGDDGRIVEARFKTFGCAPAIATSSWTTEWLRGRTVPAAGQAALLGPGREGREGGRGGLETQAAPLRGGMFIRGGGSRGARRPAGPSRPHGAGRRHTCRSR